jgi:uncharacterized protein YmfQ (DUF2313 family)
MAGTGGFAPGPTRTGASSGTRLERILQALNQMRGTYVDVSALSPAWVENMAIARASTDAYESNDRLALINDPQRMTLTLARWEAILGLTPLATDTPIDRRARVATRIALIGSTPTRQTIVDALTAALGSVFVALWEIPFNQIYVTAIPWASTVSHILVQVQLPAGYTPAQFATAASQAGVVLEPLVPAWTTWDVYIDGQGHVGGGFLPDPAAGFFLDEPNLNREIFAV